MYRKSQSGWLKHLDFLIIDMISLEIAFISAYFLRNGIKNLFADVLYRNMAVVLLLLDIFVMFFWESFSGVLHRGYFQEFILTLKHAGSIILLSVFYLFAFQMGNVYSRAVVILTGGIYFLLSYCTRIAWKLYLDKVKRVGSGKRSMFVVSTENRAEKLLNDLMDNNYERLDIRGVILIDVDMVGQSIGEIPVVANKDTMFDYVCREWADEVFVDRLSSASLREEVTNSFVEMGITVHWSLVKLTDTQLQRQHVENIGSYTVLSMGVNMITIRQAFVKRAVDIMGGIVGCMITLLLVILVGPLIYIKSPGPIFFKQMRIGKNGKKFEIYKFRSMYMDAEERKKELMAQNKVKDGMMFKMDYDPRIIGSEKGPGKGLGNFIRKTSIDEFPQFINVLKGDMSLVGTRPPTVDEWEKYQMHHRARLAIKPGITGLWQVSGRSSITDFEEVVKLDTKYIREWSLASDFRILCKTVLVVVKKDGAA